MSQSEDLWPWTYLFGCCQEIASASSCLCYFCVCVYMCTRACTYTLKCTPVHVCMQKPFMGLEAPCVEDMNSPFWTSSWRIHICLHKAPTFLAPTTWEGNVLMYSANTGHVPGRVHLAAINQHTWMWIASLGRGWFLCSPGSLRVGDGQGWIVTQLCESWIIVTLHSTFLNVVVSPHTCLCVCNTEKDYSSIMSVSLGGGEDKPAMALHPFYNEGSLTIRILLLIT